MSTVRRVLEILGNGFDIRNLFEDHPPILHVYQLLFLLGIAFCAYMLVRRNDGHYPRFRGHRIAVRRSPTRRR